MAATKHPNLSPRVLMLSIVAFGTLLFLMFFWRDRLVFYSKEHITKSASQRSDLIDHADSSIGLRSRTEFAAELSKVRIGDTKNQVIQRLGQPEDIQTLSDPGNGAWPYDAVETWGYGTNGHLSFPTLGTVSFNKSGAVVRIIGVGELPPSLLLISEVDLRTILRLIDNVPTFNYGMRGRGFNPLHLIKAVNALQRLGKEKALAAIDEYLRVTRKIHLSTGREGLFLVLRVLFDIPDPKAFMPRIVGGGPEPDDIKLLPRFPIMILEDVPIILVSGQTRLSGFGEPVEGHVDYFRTNGQIRSKPLTPVDNPLLILRTFSEKVGGLYQPPDGPSRPFSGKLLVANQILELIDSVYKRKRDVYGHKFWAVDNFENEWRFDKEWRPIADEVAKLDIMWNSAKDEYSFKDGTTLPQLNVKPYQRHYWWIPGLTDNASSLCLERLDQDWIKITMTLEGRAVATLEDASVQVYALTSEKTNVVKFGPFNSAMNGMGIETTWVELAEGLRVQACVTIGGVQKWGPIYTP